MKPALAFFGTLSYEFRMQIRRLSMWLTFALAAVLLWFLGKPPSFTEHTVPVQILAFAAFQFNIFLPIVVGIFLADRLPRDRRVRIEELMKTLPSGCGARIFGKYAGCTLAILIPLFLLYSLHIGRLLVAMLQAGVIQPGGLPSVIGQTLVVFAAMVLPGIAFVAAFSLACTAIMWVPLYQFCFIGYWFWGNLLPAGRGIPTLSDTLLTPIGTYAALGFFGKVAGQVKQATVLQGWESIVLLLGCASLALLAAWGYLGWRQEHP